MKKLLQLCVGGAMAALIALAPIAAAQERTGTSQADLPNYSGAYTIENATGITIYYDYRWGNKSEWKTMALRSRATEKHSYPLGADRNAKAPTPYVRFDRIIFDNGVTFQEYKMEFHAVGGGGYGATENKTGPKRYVFSFAANGRDLDST
jgi:hypothetical protein